MNGRWKRHSGGEGGRGGEERIDLRLAKDKDACARKKKGWSNCSRQPWLLNQDAGIRPACSYYARESQVRFHRKRFAKQMIGLSLELFNPEPKHAFLRIKGVNKRPIERCEYGGSLDACCGESFFQSWM